ncbi:MAG: Maf family nucleotide pyrophosphatase [Casimicrobiaceae bacterium]|nr:Maf family nucleotide pyrophosphatase [Casimicrobiaceae bacterium]MCX8099500.1 Maf family nucleotide pyrophosphatase [Casimicrobiaceae bacterium]MDW8312823.1 Maf family nucleotide pyrophosphatase [Burkholderiales bacterium]
MDPGPLRRSNAPPLILASTSRYRRALLERLGWPFRVVAPNVQEEQRAGEQPREHCARLACEKAQAVLRVHPEAVVIGSDQVLDLDGEAISKPGDFSTALDQLRRCRGRKLRCHTAVCVASRTGSEVAVVPTEIVYRNLTDEELIAYLEREQPFDAAGAVKVETAGIKLLARVTSDDPTALVGLPLIRLCDLLAPYGYR